MTDRFLYHIVCSTSEYVPYTKGSQFYDRLVDRMVDVETWETKILVDIEHFEKLAFNNYELAITYVDLFSKSAKFVLLFFEIESINYQFYCMVDNMEIVLIFFRKI